MCTIERISATGPSSAKASAFGLILFLFGLLSTAQAADVLRLPTGELGLSLKHYSDILLDPDRSLSYDDARASHRFRPVRPGDLHLDFSRGRYWLRFAVANPGDRVRSTILHVRPSHLGDATLFNADGKPIAAVNNEYLVRKPVLFELVIPAGAQRLYHLRLDGEGQALASLSLADLRHFTLQFLGEFLLNGIGIGALGFAMACNLVLFLLYPANRQFFLLTLYSLCNLSVIAASWGYFATTTTPTSPFENPAFFSLTHLSMALSVLIGRGFLPGSVRHQQPWNALYSTLVGINLCAALLFGKLASALTVLVVVVTVSGLLISLRPFLYYLQTRDQTCYYYLLTRAWLLLFLGVSVLLYLQDRVSFEVINVILLLGGAAEALALSTLALRYGYRLLRDQQAQDVQVARLEAETRGRSETLHHINRQLISPLSSIFGMTEMLRNTATSARQSDYLNTLRAAGEELLGCIESLQATDPLAEQPATTPELLFDLRQLLRDCAEEARASGTPATLRDAAATPHLVVGDPGRLRQLLAQLLITCRQHRSEGDIGLGARWRDQRLAITIEYQGAPIHLETGAPSDGEPRAAVVDQLLQALGGDLQSHSHGDRQTLTVALPLLPWRDQTPLPEPLVLRSRRLLVVDPAYQFCLQIRKQTAQWGMQSFIAHNHHQALALNRNQLLLRAPLDIVLISDSGEGEPEALAQQLQRECRDAQLRAPTVIFISDTGNPRPPTPDQARVLTKPIAGFTLKRLIEEAVLEHKHRGEIA